MNSIVKSLYDITSQMVSCENRLEPYKMNQKQIKQTFAWLDHRRRGSVDVSDFYAKFSQLNEPELFFIFKFLDVSRKGAFTEQDLMTTLLRESPCNRVTQDDSVRSFTNLVRILKATYYLIQQQKRKSSLTESIIQMIFLQATLNKKEKIDITDLIVLFKESDLEVTEKMLIYIKTNIFYKQALTLKQFTQALSQFTCSIGLNESSQSKMKKTESKIHEFQTPSIQASVEEKSKNVKKINSQIDKVLQKYKSGPDILNIPQRVRETEYFSPQIANYHHMRSKKQNNMFGFQQDSNPLNPNIKDELYFQKYKEIESLKMGQYPDLANPSDQSFKQINKRREQLRKGSLERQRIIDELMNKKKSQFAHNSNKPGMFYTHNLRIQSKQTNQPSIASIFNKQRPLTPCSKTIEHPNFETLPGKFYENTTVQRQMMFRPNSTSKTANSFFDRNSEKPDFAQFYRKGAETPKAYAYEKENILKKAEEEATRKIEQIQRRARLKVMEKRSIAGVYNKWLK